MERKLNALIYLDLCSIQRPLDTQSQVRITLESEAVLAIIALCTVGRLRLASSDILRFEVMQNTQAARREHATEVLAAATEYVRLDEQVERRAETFVQQGVKPLDALHLASAEAANATYFCTCDDRLLRKIRQMADLRVKPFSPLELLEEVSL
jgi:predicted nucleic acid-binding protein